MSHMRVGGERSEDADGPSGCCYRRNSYTRSIEGRPSCSNLAPVRVEVSDREVAVPLFCDDKDWCDGGRLLDVMWEGVLAVVWCVKCRVDMELRLQ